MAKRDAATVDQTELAEELIKSLGGLKAFAQTLAGAVKSGDNLLVKEKMLTLIVRILDRMKPAKSGPSEMTDAEVDDAIKVRIVREFASMPEPEYRATIQRIENARASQEAGYRDPPSGDAAVGAAAGRSV